MSIASQITRLNQAKSSIKEALENKGVSVGNAKLDAYATLIDEMQVGGGGQTAVTPKAFNFYDYDGVLLYSYTYSELQALTELPTPTIQHNNLTFDGWNWSLTDLLAYDKMNVGAIYHTTDGKIWIYVDIYNQNYTTFRVGLAINGTAEVDWGDGSSTTTFTGTSTSSLKYSDTHTYELGSYIVKISVSGTCAINGNSSQSQLFNGSSASRYYAQVIKKILLPNSVTSIGQYAFTNCYALQSINIPNGAKPISSYTFQSCYALQSINIPNGVPYIDPYTFQYCYAVQSIILPRSVYMSFGSNAFSYCYSLQSIILPRNATSIDSSTFYYCSALTSITIPNGVTSINGSAFQYCTALKEIHFKRTTPPTFSSTRWIESTNLTKIYVPKGSLDAYKNATNSLSNTLWYVEEE